VDDEPVIRKGISAFIDWEKEGMTVDDQYSNGSEALEALKKNSFDILITDIKMPSMNGIELMKQAMELYPWLKVILISNYSDFEYVKEGLKLGAVDYLLKLTLTKDDLLAVLRQCISILEKERRRNTELIHYQQYEVYLTRKRIEQEIKRLIVQENPPLGAESWVPSWLEDSYSCIYLILDSTDEWRENHGYLYVQFLLEELQKMFYEQVEEGVAFLVSESALFIIVPNSHGMAQQSFLEWKQLMETKWGISMSAGFVTEIGIGCILDGFSNSYLVCQRRFFEGLGGLYSIESSNVLIQKTAIVQKQQNDWKPFFDMVSNGDPVSSAIEIAFDRWKSGTLDSEQVKQEAFHLLKGTYELNTNQNSPLSEEFDLLCRAETLEEMAAVLISQLEEIRTPILRKLADKDYNEELITKALEYIAAHYTDNLTLQSVADIVHLSKSYFSLYFKKQTGRNFVDYLNDLRIREAKRLLAENESRVYDIAKAAGFNDVKYFSKLFKKISGLTPIEYREKHQATRLSID
jgi:two-component system response regulator YesN